MPVRPKPFRPDWNKREPREGSTARKYDSRWQRARLLFLAKPENRLCRHCKDKQIIKVATEVDHIVPHRGDDELFWDSANWQGLCKSCHSRKTRAGK